MLGLNTTFAQAVTKSRFGNSSDNFIMESLTCNGEEATLEDCGYLVKHDCEGTEAAGVICHGKF